uniref:Uncharacterized protein n=1 Tax=Anopheles culicifacies TaxID=139723 RepID=A0A182MDC7_9DIPT
METIKSLLLQTSPGAGPTISTEPDYAVPHRKVMQDPFGSPAHAGHGPTLAPIVSTVTNNCGSDDVGSQTVIDDDSTHKEEPGGKRTASSTADFIHPKLSKLKQPPVIVGVAVKRSLRKPPEVITTRAGAMAVVSLAKETTLKASTLEQWHKDIFEVPSTTLPLALQYGDLVMDAPEESFVTHSADSANNKTKHEATFLEDSNLAQSDAVVGDTENGSQKDSGSDNDLIDLIDFSSDQEEGTNESIEAKVQETSMTEAQPVKVDLPETQNEPITCTGRVKKVTFLLDDDPFRNDDSDNDSDIVKDPQGERDSSECEVSEEEDEAVRIDGEALDIDSECYSVRRLSVDESDPTINGRRATRKHHPPCHLRNEISTETRQTDDGVSRPVRDGKGSEWDDVNGRKSAAESSHVDSEAGGRWSPQRILEMADVTEAPEHGWLETEMVQRACSSPLHTESESHHRHRRHHRHEREENLTIAICPAAAVSANSDGGAATQRIDETLACTIRPSGTAGTAASGQRADVCLANACAGTESINGERRRKHQHHGSTVKHDPHDVGPGVKGRPKAPALLVADGGSGDERSVVALSNVKLSSAPIDERHQHAGSDIEVCCIDGRDLNERKRDIQRDVTPSSYRACAELDGRLPAPSSERCFTGERERIDERCYVDDGNEAQQRLASESTGEHGSLLRGLEYVGTSSFPTAVGPCAEDEEGKGRSKGLGQIQLTPNGTVARTVQTSTTECEEKSTQVSAKGHTRTPAGPLSSDSESENYYGTCSPPTVEHHRHCAYQRGFHPEGRECPSCTQTDPASSSVLVEVTLSAHICVPQQQGPFSFRETSSSSCHCGENSRVLRDSATNTQDREGEDSDGSASVASEGARAEGVQSRTGHRNNPSSADSGIIIIDDDVDGATVDDGVYPCRPRPNDESGCVNIVTGPAERRDQHQNTQTEPFEVNFIDSEIRPQGSLTDHHLVLPANLTQEEVLEGASVSERVQSEPKSECPSTVSVPLEGYPAQDNTDAREASEVNENSNGAGGVECFEASQRLKRLEERFRGFAYTKKFFRESISHGLSGLGARDTQKYGGASSQTVGGSLPSLLVCAGHPDARSSSTDYANTNTFAAGSPSLRPSAEDDARGYGGSDANVTLLRSPTQRNRRGLLSSVSTSSLGSSSPSSSRGFEAVTASSASAASESSERKPSRSSSVLLASRKTSSLNCLQQDATRDEDDTESYLLSNRKNHNNNRSPHDATLQPTPSLNRAPRASWTRPILPPLSSSLLSLSASSLLSLSCLDLERQNRQRAASQAPSSKAQETEIVAEGKRQDKNNNGPAEENGLSKAVSLPSLLSPVVHQQKANEFLGAGGSTADRVSSSRATETVQPGTQNQLRYQRQPRVVEELRRNTDTPESSGAESEEICKIFPGGKARIGDPLEVVETVIVSGSTEEEDNDDEDDDEEEVDTASHIVLGAVGEDILNNNHSAYLDGAGDEEAQQDEFVQLEKLLAADPHTNCEFDTRHLQDYEPEVYRIKYCYDELEEELEEQQEQEAANDLLVVLRGTRPLPVGPPPAVHPPPPPPPKAPRVSVGEQKGSVIYSTPRFSATVPAGVPCSVGASVQEVYSGRGVVLPVSAKIADDVRESAIKQTTPSGVVVALGRHKCPTSGPSSVSGCSGSTGEVSDRDIPPPPPPPKARNGARGYDGCGCVIEAIPLYRSEAEAFATGGDAMRETATGTLRGLLKKPNRPPPVRKNRVVFDETRNEFFEADYIILIREDCPYDEEDEEPCTCGEHELVRICCDEGCNCGYTDDGRTPPVSVMCHLRGVRLKGYLFSSQI